jgi:hypothetical protein
MQKKENDTFNDGIVLQAAVFDLPSLFRAASLYQADVQNGALVYSGTKIHGLHGRRSLLRLNFSPKPQTGKNSFIPRRSSVDSLWI